MVAYAVQYANLQHQQQIAQLQQVRDVQAEQLQQQRIIAEQNFIEQGRNIADSRAENTINDATTDFTKTLKLQQDNLNRDLSDLQRTGQYRIKEMGRDISDLNQDLALQNEGFKQDLDRTNKSAEYGLTEAGADLSLLSEQQKLKQGREEAMLEYMRGQDQLGTDKKLLDISQAGAEQTTSYQKMSQDMQLYGQMLEVDTARKQGQQQASNDKNLARQMSTSDYRANYAKSGVEGLMKAQDTATLNNYMMKGSLNNQLDINLAEIQTKRLGLEQKGVELNTALRLDEIKRGQQAGVLQTGRELETLKNQLGMFILPEASRRLGMMGAQQQVASSKMGTQLDRMGDQQSLTNHALTNEYSRGADQTLYNIDQLQTGMGRVVRDSDLQQAGVKNDLTYQQALHDLIYGNQSLDKNYQMGVEMSEAERQSTMQARDIDQLQSIAAQKAALSTALSGIQGQMLPSAGSGGGLSNAIQGVGNLFDSYVKARQQGSFNKTLQNQNTNLNAGLFPQQIAQGVGSFFNYPSSNYNSFTPTSFGGNTASLPSFNTGANFSGGTTNLPSFK